MLKSNEKISGFLIVFISTTHKREKDY